MRIDQGKFTGCFLGLAMGDVFGAKYEGGVVERLLWLLIGKTTSGRYRYTDDTQMSLDIAKSFIINQCIEQNHLAETFADGYRWSRGYGAGAATVLKKIRDGHDWKTVNRLQYATGSFGNGAAMRAPILALCYPHDQDALLTNARLAAEITHAHPLAIEGALIIAIATRAALLDCSNEQVCDAVLASCEIPEYQEKVRFCRQVLLAEQYIEAKVIKRYLGNRVSALDSCVTALYFALVYRECSQLALLESIVQLGGDTDTIAAMANAIWGAFNGLDHLDDQLLVQVEEYEKILDISEKLYAMYE